jgi:hypothetical protein
MLEQQLMNRDACSDAIIIEIESDGPQYLADLQVLYQITKRTLEENNIDINTLSIKSSMPYIQSIPEEVRRAINIFISLRYLRRFEERMSLRGGEFLEEFYHITLISITTGCEATYLGSEWKNYVESKQKQKDNQKNGGECRASKYEKSEEVAKEIFMRLWKASKKPKSFSQWAYILNKEMPESQSIPKLAKGTLRQKIPIWLTECKK